MDLIRGIPLDIKKNSKTISVEKKLQSGSKKKKLIKANFVLFYSSRGMFMINLCILQKKGKLKINQYKMT